MDQLFKTFLPQNDWQLTNLTREQSITSDSYCLQLDSKQPRFFQIYSSQGNYFQSDKVDKCLT